MRDESDEAPANAADATLEEGGHGPLALLRGLRGFAVAHGDPDVRGWHVFASDGHRIGEVHDLLVDTQALKVRYLDVEIYADLLLGSTGDREPHRQETIPGAVSAETFARAGAAGLASIAGGIAGLPPTAVAPLVTGTYGVGAPVAEEGTAESHPHRSITEHLVRESLQPIENEMTRELRASGGVRAHGGRRHVLIPIGRARLDRDDDRVFVDGLRGEEVLSLPEYSHGPVSRAFEAELLQRFDRGYMHSPERDFYSHSLYDQDAFYSPRRQDRGRVPEAEAPREAMANEPAVPSRGRS